MNADQIYQSFRDKWQGTDDELTTALEQFYRDIRDSFEKAVAGEVRPSQRSTVFAEVDDYVSNHYLS